MHVTGMPKAVADAKTVTVAKGKSEIIGKEGLLGQVRFLSDGFVLTADFAHDHTAGYEPASGEVVKFADRVAVYNSGSDSAKVSVLIFDIV